MIAGTLGIQNYGKLTKDALIPLIRERLALVENCADCGGGPCVPDDHIFPATEPGSARGSGSDGNDSKTSRTNDSPSREHLRSLNRAQHPTDATITGFEIRTSFVQHVEDQFYPRKPGSETSSGQQGSSGDQQGSSAGRTRNPGGPLP